MATELRQLARFIAQLRYEDVPPDVLDTVSGCVLDSVSAALGAIHDPQIKRVSKLYLDIAGDKPAASVWGQGCKAPLLTAVFLNAMMGHTLELDDVHTNSKTHIGIVVIPAAWGLAEALGKSGKELLLAVLCGYECMARIGMAFGVSSHRNLGWHVTATAGTFGAAAASAKILGLDEDQIVSALGLAGTQSFGTWAFLGDSASNKVLHPARAATSGCESALLAKAGMTGAENILTTEDGGLLGMMSHEHDVSRVNNGLGEVWEIRYMDNKPYPCCRSTHCTIDSALALRNEQGVKAENIEHVQVRTYLVGNKQCGMSEGSRRPKTPIDAKFSTPYTVASAFLRGNVTGDDFTPEAIGKPDVQELLRRVEVVSDDEFTQAYPERWGCKLIATLKDGRKLSAITTDASGSVLNPLTPEQLKRKAMSLLNAAKGQQAETVADQLLAIRDAKTLPAL